MNYCIAQIVRTYNMSNITLQSEQEGWGVEIITVRGGNERLFHRGGTFFG